jgi:two-component system sensor histidine kinase QseC
MSASSLRHRLLLLVLGGVALVWGLAAVKTWLDARHEAEEIYDAHLAQSARVLGGLLRHEALEEAEAQRDLLLARQELGTEGLARYPRLAALIAERLRGEAAITLPDSSVISGHKYESRIALTVRKPGGALLLRTPQAPALAPAPEGFHEARAAGREWRVFSFTEPETGLLIQAAERLDVRGELVGDITRNALLPLLAALPALGLMLWFSIGHALAPLARLAAAVARRAPGDMAPVADGDAPREVQPLLAALNRLFARQQFRLARERRFTADAAHELRTPLAALRVQAQVAQGAASPGARDHALARILEGVDRATHQVEQLLALARADHAAGLLPQPLDLAALARDTVQLLAPWALSRGVTLECDCRAAPAVHGEAAALASLLRNLTDNAVRYGGSGGVVRVRVLSGVAGAGAVLEVEDAGPGIPQGERARVLERFHRGVDATGQPGSGLGLSIVQRVAEAHGARLELEAGAEGGGLCVRVHFPAV